MGRWRAFGLPDDPVTLSGPGPAEGVESLSAIFTKVDLGKYLGLTFEGAGIVANAHAHSGTAVGCDLGVPT
ncbi:MULTISPECIES: hypothetical protein [unclassified Methylobacterium]|jgi:hypothetical protein|uniref:hypothetical protein n=1 Tax=unclassified Methylobacterium TaxID=2615210 RepID=UPI0005BD04EA|nr:MULTISPECIES: hypothetical protein [unclassified Methylobacterium]RUP17203.1 MAG: hypothetical protein EKK44_30280 [Methylobacterium sp.]SFU96810.1 hypothetical protein SAMN02799643_03532 [Methylobacterium sp. UNCCL125]